MWLIDQGAVHKLRLQDLAFFDPLPPSVYIFYGIKVYKKSIFLTTYPPPHLQKSHSNGSNKGHGQF